MLERVQNALESQEEVLEFVALGRKPKGQLSGSLCCVALLYLRHHLFWVEPYLHIINEGERSILTLWTPSHSILRCLFPAEQSAV